MSARRITLWVVAAAILGGIAALFFLRLAPGAPPAASRGVGSPSHATAPNDPKSKVESAPAEPNLLAEKLNAPQGNIRGDLEVLNNLFVNFQTNFPRVGNPVGENAEITAALTGANPLGFAFLPKNHPAINRAGELCDRWGTPFRFHQLSGTQMEIYSAGPDKKFKTADDVAFTPWAK